MVVHRRQIKVEAFLPLRERSHDRDNRTIQLCGHRSVKRASHPQPPETHTLSDPRKVIKTGPGHGEEADPFPALEKELAKSTVATIPSIVLPPLTGGAVGYVGYDCVKYFEPKTRRDDVKDVLGVPESLFMLFDTIVAFDHFQQVAKVITYIQVPENLDDLDRAYAEAKKTLQRYVSILKDKEMPLPPQGPIQMGQEYKSNIGKEGYENHVKKLKEHIAVGDIIQAVPSQRFARPTSLHPFNIYRHLRNVNPSPYLFFLDCEDFQIVGASPELLVKEELGRIITHPIAGTVVRGKTLQEDEALAQELRNSLKDRAEHVRGNPWAMRLKLTLTSQVMLVDLARNDVNRCCDPRTTRVDKLMVVQKVSLCLGCRPSIGPANAQSSRTFNIWCRRSRAYYDRARRVLMPFAPSSLPAR
jgi:anthranilate synthase component 1